MTKQFRVVDCRTKVVQPTEIIASAVTAEHAAKLALGETLVRGSMGNKAQQARVYSKGQNDVLTLVRPYAPIAS